MVVTPDVVLLKTPCVLLVTLKITVQLPFAGIVILLKLRLVLPAGQSTRRGADAAARDTSAGRAHIHQRVGECPAGQSGGVGVAQVKVTTEMPPD